MNREIFIFPASNGQRMIIHLVVFWMNRHQDDLKLLLTNAQTGDQQPFYTKKKTNILLRSMMTGGF